MNTLQFNAAGLEDMTLAEMQESDGGSEPTVLKWIKGATWTGAALYVMEHWADIKKGLADGWNEH